MYKMKKPFAFLIALVIAISLMPSMTLAAETVTVFVNGEHLEFDVDPIMEDGRVLVPMRGIFEAMGATVSWDNDSKTAVAARGDILLSVTIDSPTMIKNREPIYLDVPARIVDGRTMVPVRAISEGLEAKVEWNGENKWVLITMPEAAKGFELTAEDMEILRKRYDIIRYGFEQITLSESMFESADICISCINDRIPDFLTIPYSLWASDVTSNILYVMSTSDHDYYLDAAMSMDDVVDSCEKIMIGAGLYPLDIFDVSYATLQSGQSSLLMVFRNTDSFMACMYIGVTVDKNNKLRFFTAETDPVTDYIYFCEITPDGRGTWFTIDPNLNAFLAAMDYVLQSGMSVQVYIPK